MHFLGTCEKKIAAQCQIPIFCCGRNTFFPRSRCCAAVVVSQVPNKCTDLYISLLYFLMLGTYNKFARENNFLVLGVCFAQPSWSARRRFATSESHYYRRIVSFPQQQKFDEMRCKLDSTQNPLSLEKYPTPPS